MKNNNISVIPFYDSLNEQMKHKWGVDLFPLRADSRLLPFVIKKSANIEIREISLINNCTGEVFFIESTLRDNGLVIADEYIAFCPPSEFRGIEDIEYGCYYIEFVLGEQGGGEETEYSMYSEVINIGSTASLEQLTKIEWYSVENVVTSAGIIPYGDINTFKNFIYLDTDIVSPQYQTSEEGEERDGYFFPIKQLSWKEFNFTFVAPECICDVIRLVFLADVVKVTPPSLEVYMCNTFNMDVNWLEQGIYASVKCNFTTDTVVKNIGKAYSVDILPINEALRR